MSRDARTLAAVGVLGLRIAYGAGLVAAPGRLSRSWLGAAGGTPPTQIALRGLGAREIALHAAALTVALRGGPLRPWLAASLAGDLSDAGATFAGRAALPAGAAAKTAAVAGGSAVLTAALAAVVDR
jgi:hypothetical protein